MERSVARKKVNDRRKRKVQQDATIQYYEKLSLYLINFQDMKQWRYISTYSKPGN
jgi:hypothetical protein